MRIAIITWKGSYMQPFRKLQLTHWYKLIVVVVPLVSLLTLSVQLTLTYAAGQLDTAHSRLGSSTDCPSPPQNFDFLHASASELAYYGLPVRPAGNSKAMAHWIYTLQHAKKHVCGVTVTNSQTDLPLGGLPLDSGSKSYQNWAGYEVDSSNLHYAIGDWNVPCYNSSKSPSASRAVSWVGLGGVYGNLWQGGTTEDPTFGYHMWYEFVPGIYITYVNITVHCTDSVTAQVDYNLTYSNKSYIYLEDYTNGQYASETYAAQPNLATAEWIDERPSCGTGLYYQLADFNSVNWSSAQTGTSNTNYYPISHYTNYAASMYDKNNTKLAAPGSLGSNGETFTDYWITSGVYSGCG